MKKVNIPQIIKRLRKFADLTQDQLTEKVSFSKRTLADYESGETIPTVDKFIEIAEFCNISDGDILNLLTGQITDLSTKTPSNDQSQAGKKGLLNSESEANPEISEHRSDTESSEGYNLISLEKLKEEVYVYKELAEARRKLLEQAEKDILELEARIELLEKHKADLG